MAVEVLDWPAVLPPSMATSWFLTVETKSPGRGLDGRRQVIFRENRVWGNQVTLSQLWGARAAAFQALLDDMKGSYGLVRMPVCNSFTLTYGGDETAFYALFGLTAGEIAHGLAFGDGTTFSDTSGFEIPDHADPTVTADVPVGATLIGLDGFLGDNLAIGGFFSVNGFLYRVAANDGVLVRFNPPLREALTAGTVVAVNSPAAIVRLSEDMQARLQLAQRKIGTVPSFDVEEAFER